MRDKLVLEFWDRSKNLNINNPNNKFLLSIPHIKIKDFRPSLLNNINNPEKEMTPFLIRDLNVFDFEGILGDKKSFTGKCDLYFINSFKRDNSVFDFPADVLSRIIGFDLELLTPICGKIDMDIMDGKFYFQKLYDSYSVSNRSTFFLHEKGNRPYIDFNGEIYLNIAMKQHVLFKFTESFVISITGNIGDPKFNLRKKRGFF